MTMRVHLDKNWPAYVGLLIALFPVLLYFAYDIYWPLLFMMGVMVVVGLVQVVAQSISQVRKRHARR